jgi:hypothetical protein
MTLALVIWRPSPRWRPSAVSMRWASAPPSGASAATARGCGRRIDRQPLARARASA